MDVIGSGALNLDLMYEVKDLSVLKTEGVRLKPGQEISIDFDAAERLLLLLERHGAKVAESGGGSAANTVCVLAALGESTGFIGTVGDDTHGQRVLSSMKGVDCSLVARQGRTSLCIVLLEKATRDRAMIVAAGRNAGVNAPDENHVHALSGSRILHLSSLVQEEGMDFQARLAAFLRDDQILSLDPGEIYARRGIKALSPLLSRTDFLFVTEQEVRMMTGEPPDRGLEMLLPLLRTSASSCLPFKYTGGPVILCKQGARGATLYSPSLKQRVHARKVSEIVDNTGAGDSFNAGFLHAMLAGRDESCCLNQAVRMAALSLGGYGRNWLNNVPKN